MKLARVNERHLAILRMLLDLNLRPGLNVLEAGCGTGPVTSLIAAVLDGDGELIAIDLDRDAAIAASERLVRWPNVAVQAADAVTFQSGLRFDLVVLPDLIEHVQPDRRTAMIVRLAAMLRPQGWMLIHTPNPVYLEWLRATAPGILQPIDVPLHPDEIASAATAAALFVHRIDTYKVWDANCDYQAIVLRPLAAASSFK